MKCTKCNEENPERAKFCMQCGTKLTKDEEIKDIRTCPGEIRNVTVLFSDLKGFTSLSEQIDKEVVKDFIDEIFTTSSHIIRTYGGIVDKYMGDAIMALFGVPESHGDDPVRAINAALRMQEELSKIIAKEAMRHKSSKVRERISSIKMRIGINTGEVIWGEVGGDRATVMGDAVNIAQRIESVSEEGKVTVGELTKKLSGNHFLFEQLEPKKFKGKSEAVRIYMVCGVAKSTPFTTIGTAPMLGREDKLNEIYSLFEESVRNGKPQFILITGEAGIGKSRLVYELRKRISQKFDSILYLCGRCVPYGSSPYHPFREAMRLHFRLTDKANYIEKFCSGIENDLSQLKEFSAKQIENFANMIGISILPRDRSEVS
jgi:adenylate cyclase